MRQRARAAQGLGTTRARSWRALGTADAARRTAAPGGLLLVAGVEVQRAGVDAPALTAGARAVVEHVPQVPAAAGADDLGARHEMRAVLTGLDRLGEHRVGEARPSGTGLELRV